MFRPTPELPPAFTNTVTPETYAKSVDYTLAKSRFEMARFDLERRGTRRHPLQRRAPLVLPCFQHAAGSSVWAGAAFLLAVGVVLSATDLPFEWHAQFHLEERFGFNTTTAAALVAGPGEGFAAGPGAGVSVAGFDFETGGVAGRGVVVLGVG